MPTIVSIAFVLSYIMVIWLKSNAIVEYFTLLKLDYFFHIHEYNELEKNSYGGNYVEFLYEYYRDSFFVRLLVCPICISFWLGLFEALYVNTYEAIISAPLILFFYLLFNKMF